ncbi:DUF1990 family protein [Streptomyces abyssalis]|uniref:DUF1990 family protein n=1 Tax=Streptomyces abyssalis TaxID=933944 RepID=UPI00085BC4E0
MSGAGRPPPGEPLNYPGAGATADATGSRPAGFRTLHVSTQVGSGGADFELAAEAVMTWRLHRAAGVRFVTEARRAAPGVEVLVGLGWGGLRVNAPCRVVWTADRERRTGWGYGTLPGHPVRGEEAFVVVQDEDGTVRLDVLAFSRPSAWFTVAAGPLLPVFQRWYARRCGRVLRRLVRTGRRTGEGPEARTGAPPGGGAAAGGGTGPGRGESGHHDGREESGTEGTDQP